LFATQQLIFLQCRTIETFHKNKVNVVKYILETVAVTVMYMTAGQLETAPAAPLPGRRVSSAAPSQRALSLGKVLARAPAQYADWHAAAQQGQLRRIRIRAA
jgi:hypothetical protein